MDSWQTTAALNKLSDAVLLVDQDGRVVRHNAAAERMFNKGEILHSISGRLHAGNNFATERLRELVRQAASIRRDNSENCGGAIILETLNGDRWGTTVVPLRPSAKIFDLVDQYLALVTFLLQ